MIKDNRTIEEIQKSILLLQEQTESIKKKGEEELNALKKEGEARHQKHLDEMDAIKKETEAIKKETEAIKKETEAIKKESEAIKKESEAIKKKGEEELNALKKETEAIKKAHETSSKKLESTMNNLGFNIGMGVEEMFLNGLKDNPTLNGIHFENVIDNVKIINEKGSDATEIDILMLNGTSVGLIETKHRFNKEDLQKFIEKQFPIFKKYGGNTLRENIYLYIAGLSFDKEVILDAKKAGVGVLHLKNDIILVEGEVRAFKN